MHQPHPTEAAWLHAGRIPSLDGLRAMSVMLVVLSHLVIYDLPKMPRWTVLIGGAGDIGVDVFFVISGLLITLLLMRERQRTGRVSLRQFYIRRSFRIVPAYLTYLLIVGGLPGITQHKLTAAEWICSLTYTTSIFSVKPQPIAHFWSLSVEEHFYLLWPFLFAWVQARWLLVLTAGYSLVALGVRIIALRDGWPLREPEHFTFARLDAIACGCLLAICFGSPMRTALLSRRNATCGLSLGVLVLVSADLVKHYASDWSYIFRDLLYPLIREWSILGIVWGCVVLHETWIGWILNVRPLVVLGWISYSIYLWQEFFITPVQPNALFHYPGNLLAILAAASASYLLIEQPFLQMKLRFEPTDDARATASPPAGNAVDEEAQANA